ncbi:MAG: UDP-N-acetylmuramoyl-tripeptide--D-alanyl-D-alanine ligase, partial [Pseudomonadales bacterium]|nr:UDP-N-acetylmuramoyl-tripeptide--D-alanyl-D-alanine ligase [Pseudomonadales bacterium]
MMPGLQLEDMAQACNAVLHGANAAVTSVGIDSRNVCPGQLFVALPGARVDGHQFVGQARAAGAVGAVVEQLQEVDLPQLLVSDAAAALAAMARLNRSLFSGTVVA